MHEPDRFKRDLQMIPCGYKCRSCTVVDAGC